MIVEILKDSEVIRSMEIEEAESSSLLSRAKLDAQVMTRDNDGDYSARFKPEPVEIPEEVPDEPA